VTIFAYKCLVVLGEAGIYGLLALSLALAFRVVRFPDLTLEGSFTFGSVVLCLATRAGASLPMALACASLAGVVAGCVTALTHIFVRVPPILAGILTWTALYSVNLRLLGSPNATLPDSHVMGLQRADASLLEVGWASASVIWIASGLAILFIWTLLESSLGLRLRCARGNPYMAVSLGIRPNRYTILGLAVSNGLAGLAAGLLATKGGFVDVNGGNGMLIAGVAPLFLGGVFLPGARSATLIGAALLGTLMYRALVTGALEIGMDPRDLRLFTAVLVLLGVALSLFGRGRRRSFDIDLFGAR
jgi:putative ABC transport system permease protein